MESFHYAFGGSDLGPVMAYEAMRHYSERSVTFRFVSNVDGIDLIEVTRDIDPAIPENEIRPRVKTAYDRPYSIGSSSSEVD